MAILRTLEPISVTYNHYIYFILYDFSYSPTKDLYTILYLKKNILKSQKHLKNQEKYN